MVEVVLHAVRGERCLSNQSGATIEAASLGLSDRLLAAIADWESFFDQSDGVLSDHETREEFTGQGFKIAHGIRRELKGSKVWLTHPVSGVLIPIRPKD